MLSFFFKTGNLSGRMREKNLFNLEVFDKKKFDTSWSSDAWQEQSYQDDESFQKIDY